MGFARTTLERFLAIARRTRASELRLVSGQHPLLIIESKLQRLEKKPRLSLAVVRDVHLECLTMAKKEIPTRDATFAYEIATGAFGRVRCMYSLRRRARTLTLLFEEQAKQLVEATAGSKLPSLRAEAEPDD